MERYRKHLLLGLAVSWVVVVSAVMVVFHARHNLSLKSVDSASAEQWIQKLPWETSTAVPANSHRLYHLLASDCGCSQNVLKALIERSPSASWNETVMVLVPSKVLDASKILDSSKTFDPSRDQNLVDIKTRLEAKHYLVRFVDQAALLPTQGVPAVVAFIGDRNVYAGGYLKTRVNDPSELGLDTFFKEIEMPGGAKARPIFGCSVSKGLRQAQKPEEWLRVVSSLAQE